MGGTLLGGVSFLNQLKPLLSEQKESRDINAVQRLADRPALRDLVGNISDKEKKVEAVYAAVTTWEYSLAEVGRVLGVHYSTISRMVKKGEKMLQSKT